MTVLYEWSYAKTMQQRKNKKGAKIAIQRLQWLQPAWHTTKWLKGMAPAAFPKGAYHSTCSQHLAVVWIQLRVTCTLCLQDSGRSRCRAQWIVHGGYSIGSWLRQINAIEWSPGNEHSSDRLPPSPLPLKSLEVNSPSVFDLTIRCPSIILYSLEVSWNCKADLKLSSWCPPARSC